MIDDRFYTMRGQTGKASGVPSVMPDDIGSLVSIVVQTPPTKTEYYEGDYIDLTGIEILGVYQDDTTIDITPWCTVQVRAPLALSSTTPIVWFQNLSTTFAIQITGKPIPVPSSAVHIFHFENNGYDALGNYKDGDGVQKQFVVPHDTTYGGGYVTGCRPRLGLDTMAAQSAQTHNPLEGRYQYMKTPTHTDLLKNGASITIAFWSNAPMSLRYGAANGTSTGGSPRVWECAADQTGYARLHMMSGSGIYYSGRERTGPEVDVTGSATTSGETWYHCAFVVDHGATMYAFIDGNLACFADLTNTAWNTTGGNTIDLYGTFDELLIADTALWTSSFVRPTGPYNT